MLLFVGTRETEVREVERRPHVAWLPDGGMWTDRYCRGMFWPLNRYLCPMLSACVVIWVVVLTPCQC